MARSKAGEEAGAATAERPDPGSMTLESFVAELHDEGVAAGRREAETIIHEAREEAETIVRRAQAEADEILRKARQDAEEAGSRGRAELELAVRDAVLHLHAALTAILRTLVDQAIRAELEDADVLKALVSEVVAAYAREDARGRPQAFRLSPEAADALSGWWRAEMSRVLGGDGKVPELHGTLAEAGFEYRVREATVDVSAESVVEQLMELVRPGLQEVVESVAREAIDQAGSSVEDATPVGAPGAGAP